MKANDNKMKDELSKPGKMLILGISVIAGGFLTSKLQERYPNGELSWLIRTVVVCIGLLLVFIMILMFILVIILLLYEIFTGNHS